MNHTKISIQSLADVAAQRPIFENHDLARATRAADFELGILEAGMASGGTSVMLLMRQADGSSLYHECSANTFEALAAAVRGAVARFGK